MLTSLLKAPLKCLELTEDHLSPTDHRPRGKSYSAMPSETVSREGLGGARTVGGMKRNSQILSLTHIKLAHNKINFLSWRKILGLKLGM
jgi:hypothetical protein